MMPIRLMVWNIERFGINKLGINQFDTNASRAAYINATIAEADPDILVVIEVQTAAVYGVGTLISDTSGGPGVIQLWNALPGGTIVNNAGPWAVVPPLATNVPVSPQGNNAYSEGVGIFFRTDKLDFAGPYKWTGVGSHQGSQPVADTAAAQTYPAPWDVCLPAGNPLGGPALPQNRLSGQALFHDQNGKVIRFGFKPTQAKRKRTTSKETEDIFKRNPWHTTFVENAGTLAGRSINIWSVHFPPGRLAAAAATIALTESPDIVAPLANNETRVICGDFNVDIFDRSDPFSQLTLANAFSDRGTPTDLFDTHCFESTMMASVNNASITRGQSPDYRYMVNKGLDNILTAYGANAGAPANFLVANRVIGTPPQDVIPPPPARFTVDLQSDIAAILATPLTNPGKNLIFQRLDNYGKIGGKLGASDHAPLVIDL
jgi:hypothetical protein